MANEEHLAILKQGVYVWNRWRDENPGIVPDLTEADLRGADLEGVDFSRAVLKGVNLGGEDVSGEDWVTRGDFSGHDLIRGSILIMANLSMADLSGANLSEADLTGAKIGHTSFSFWNLANPWKSCPKRLTLPQGWHGDPWHSTLHSKVQT